jgi:hypothetical protein
MLFWLEQAEAKMRDIIFEPTTSLFHHCSGHAGERSATTDVDNHRVADGRVGEDVRRCQAPRGEVDQGPGRVARHVRPDRLPGRRQT